MSEALICCTTILYGAWTEKKLAAVYTRVVYMQRVEYMKLRNLFAIFS